MASIQKRTTATGTPSYRVRIRIKGTKSRTSSFNKMSDAKKWATQTEAAIIEGRHFVGEEAKRHTLAEAIEKYTHTALLNQTDKEQANKKPILKWWKKTIGHYLLSDLTATLFAECRDKLALTPSKKNDRLTSDTIKKYFDVIRSVLKLCINEWLWLEHSPLRDKRVILPALARGRVRYLDDKELPRFLTACKASSSPLLYPCVIIALSTGMRKSELMQLRWCNVNLGQKHAILHKTKNGERRKVPLEGLALDLLTQLKESTDSDLLFPDPAHKNKPANLRRAFDKAMESSRIEAFRWHDLRHCTASYLMMNGASAAEVAEVLGHKTLNMVKRYAHLSESHVSGVVESMNKKLFS